MDWQSIGVALATCMTALAAVITGIYNGRHSIKKDEETLRLNLEKAKSSREQAEEAAARARVEAVAADAADARKRLREMENEYDIEIRRLRKDLQRGWDLARIHFNTLTILAHFLNNIIMVYGIIEENPELHKVESLMFVVKNTITRMKMLTLPKSLEEPLPKEPD